MKSLGLRHVALNVKNAQKSKDFYSQALGMSVDWEPDPKNIYLTRDNLDNLALHEASGPPSGLQQLDHIGFFVPDYQSLQSAQSHIKSLGINLEKELKTHRDGSSSFYFRDPDGILIQILHYPKIIGSR
jgi:catechol 2,3-dioxygenase-like lactoylglutathione lyase family enzyme